MKVAVMYNTAYSGVDPDALIAVARHAEDCRNRVNGLAEPGRVAWQWAVRSTYRILKNLDGRPTAIGNIRRDQINFER